MLFNAYIICLRFTRGNTIKMTVQVEGSVSGRVQSGGVSPRTVQLGGETPDRKIHFPLMTKGERFIRCMIEMCGKKAQRHVDMGSNPRRVQSRGAAPKGDTLCH
jgi:hypothetical protein